MPHRFYSPAICRMPPRRQDYFADLAAGLLVGVVAVPLAIAFAIASGAPPAAGLVTGVVAGLIISLGGGSRFQIGGPTGAFVGLCASVIATHGMAGLALATLMAGILLIALGLLRLGSVIRLIPAPVVIGFTGGIAVIIASTQLRDALGMQIWPESNLTHFHQRILAVIDGIGSWNPWSVGLCLGTIAAIVSLRRIAPRWPGALLAIIAAALLTWAAQLPVETIGDRFGPIDAQLPIPSLSPFTALEISSISSLLQTLLALSGPALAIALLAAIESLLSATVADSMGKDQHDSDSELIGQGLANLACPLFGGLPATGAIARTATNIRAGARSPLAGAIHALTLLLIMLVAMPLVAWLPMAALAGVLLVVAYSMSEFRHWPSILRGGKGDALLLPLTFGLTVFIDLTVAVEVGVVLGLFFFVRRLSAATRVRLWSSNESAAGILAEEQVPDEVEVFEIDGPFFFGMAVHLRTMLDELQARQRVLILRMRHVSFVDATAAAALRDLISDCQAQGRYLVLSGISPQCRNDLDRQRISDLVGAANICPDIRSALQCAKTYLNAHSGI